MTDKAMVPSSLKATKIGGLNRNIEASVAEAAKGERGASGRAVRLAKMREDLLNSSLTTAKRSA